jgi:hypothetical protein
LVNAVKFLTGYSRKQRIEDYIDENDGKKKQRVIYDWKAVWEDKDSVFRENPEVAKEYFNKKALQYVTDQTPSQILGMRSDYYAPMLEHLSMAYENSKMEGWADEEILEHEEYIKELAEIQTRYGDLPPERLEKCARKIRRNLKIRWLVLSLENYLIVKASSIRFIEPDVLVPPIMLKTG